MPTDPSIILGIQNNQPDLGAIYGNALKIRQEQLQTAQLQTEMQQQNVLKQILSQPGAVDDSGKISKNALLEATRAAPQLGFKLADQNAQIDEREAQAAHLKSETVKQQQDDIREALGEVTNTYDAALSAGTKETAFAKGQEEYTAQRERMAKSGNYSEEQMARIPTKFDPDWVRAHSVTVEQAIRQREVEAAQAETKSRDKSLEGYRTASRQQRAAEFKAKVDSGAPLDDDAVDYVAQIYKLTGHIPPLGYGPVGAQNRARVFNALGKGGGATAAAGDVATAGTTKADVGSLGNITKIADASKAFEQTARKNFDLALHLAPKGVQASMGPLVNRWIQDGETIFGDSSIPAWQLALMTGLNEYAKITDGATGAAGSTVDGRRAVAEKFPSSFNTDTINKLVGIVNKDMDNKVVSYDAQRKEIQDRIRGSGGAPASGGGGSAPARSAASLPKEILAQMNQPNHTYHLSDGSVWHTDAQGHVK